MKEEIQEEYEYYIIRAIKAMKNEPYNGEESEDKDILLKEFETELKEKEFENMDVTDEIRTLKTAISILNGEIVLDQDSKVGLSLCIHSKTVDRDIEIFGNFPIELIDKYNLSFTDLNEKIIYSICCDERLSYINDTNEDATEIHKNFFRRIFMEYAGHIDGCDLKRFHKSRIVELFASKDFREGSENKNRKRCSTYIYSIMANVIKEIFNITSPENPPRIIEMDTRLREDTPYNSNNRAERKIKAFCDKARIKSDSRKPISYEEETNLIEVLKFLDENITLDTLNMLNCIRDRYLAINEEHRVVELIDAIIMKCQSVSNRIYNAELLTWIDDAVETQKKRRQFNKSIPKPENIIPKQNKKRKPRRVKSMEKNSYGNVELG